MIDVIALRACSQSTTITWATSNGNPINSGGRFTVGGVTNSGLLTIANVQLSDQGNYICTGTAVDLPTNTVTLTLIVNGRFIICADYV